MSTSIAVSSDAAALPVAFKKRAGTKANIRKRPIAPEPSDSDDSGGDSFSDNEAGHTLKRRKKRDTVVTTSSVKRSTDQDLTATKYTADRSGAITNTNDATKHSNWFDEKSQDGMSSKALVGQSFAGDEIISLPDGTYKGLANQTSFIQKNPDAPTRSVGPIKAATNVRTTTLTDYAPDVCKDYKQTGFCGFGDNCKYLHDRSDYKAGWQLDREWETVTKGKKVEGTVVANANRRRTDEEDEDKDAMLDNIPFACIICKGAYREPVVTKCGHYFCERCALGRYRKDPSCAACGSGTNGVFNNAKMLKKLLERKRERAGPEEEEEDGGEVAG